MGTRWEGLPLSSPQHDAAPPSRCGPGRARTSGWAHAPAWAVALTWRWTPRWAPSGRTRCAQLALPAIGSGVCLHTAPCNGWFACAASAPAAPTSRPSLVSTMPPLRGLQLRDVLSMHFFLTRAGPAIAAASQGRPTAAARRCHPLHSLLPAGGRPARRGRSSYSGGLAGIGAARSTRTLDYTTAGPFAYCVA